MRLATGKIVAGKVEIDGAPFVEGATVTVIAADDGEFELCPEDEAVLMDAITQANRGEFVEGAELIAKLSSQR